MKVCKKCGEINTNDCEFCCNCGESSFVFQEEIICPHCGAVNDKSFGFCVNCGNELTPAVPSAKTAVTETATVPAKTEEQPVPTSADNNAEGYTPVPVDLREQMNEVYGGISPATPAETALCPTCGAIIPIHAVYCQKCGTSVAKLHDHRVVKRKICPHCGRPNSLESQYCTYCFCTLANADTQEMQVVHDSKHLGGDTIIQAFLEDEHGKNKICTNCGTLNKLDEAFCVNCGFKLDLEDLKKYCPNCGAENPIENTFCTKCQWSFDGTSPNSKEKWICERCEKVNDVSDAYCTVCGAPKNLGRKK
jgi:ribosomal protein L40E